MELAADLRGQRPGGGVEPVGVLQDHRDGSALAAALEDAGEQRVDVVPAHLIAHLPGDLVVRDVDGKQRVEQRGQRRQLVVVGEPRRRLGLLLLLAFRRPDPEERPPYSLGKPVCTTECSSRALGSRQSSKPAWTSTRQ